MKTAVEWLVEQISYTTTRSEIISYHKDISKLVEQAKEMEREQMLGFHQWMLANDTPENGERFFHYSDSDMLTEYLRESGLKAAD